MEILDVWSNLNKQVASRTRKQVAVFPDTLKPKTERDLAVEVNVDKAIEGINKTIEQKLGSLEFFLQNAKKFQDPKFSQSIIQAIEQSTNTGDVIPLYNNIARMAHTVGLSRESIQVIQIQLQALLPNLEAITYGLLQAVNSVIGFMNSEAQLPDDEVASYPKSLTGATLDFLRTYAVYQFIKEEADKDNTATPDLLTVEALNIAFKNAFENLSASDISMIKERIPDANWLLSNGMKNVPDFPVGDYEGRLSALEEEMGFRIPSALRTSLIALPINQQKDALAKMKNEVLPEIKNRYSQQDARAIRSAEKLFKEAKELERQITKLENEDKILAEEIEAIQRGVELSPEDAERLFELQGEIPLEPSLPSLLNSPSIEAYRTEMAEYNRTLAVVREKQAEYARVKAQNEFIRNLLIPDQSESARDEQIREREEMRRLIPASLDALRRQLHQKDQRATDLLSASSSAVSALLRPKPGIVRPVKPLIEEVSSSGSGVATRGLSTLRQNYGFRDSDSEEEEDSDSEEEGDALDFDDRRNEHYYTRPR
jgi:exonuclease VII small subunit